MSHMRNKHRGLTTKNRTEMPVWRRRPHRWTLMQPVDGHLAMCLRNPSLVFSSVLNPSLAQMFHVLGTCFADHWWLVQCRYGLLTL